MHPTSRGAVAAKLLLAVAALAGLAALYTWGTLSWSFSEGERAGYVQKLSRRGWVCKTWEGELAMVTMPGAIPEKFYFSVPSDAVAAQINQSLGKKGVSKVAGKAPAAVQAKVQQQGDAAVVKGVDKAAEKITGTPTPPPAAPAVTK